MTQRDPNHKPNPESETPAQADAPQPSETTDTTAATSRVEVPRSQRAGAGRWGIALGIMAVAIGVAAAAAFMLTGQAAPSLLLGYAPADSVVYTEVRLDLPGDQRLKVGEFLSNFPGFDDQSTIETKIADVLDRLVREPTGGEQDYSNDIKPWFAGELGLAVSALPDPSVEDPNGRFLAMVSVSDAEGATAWFEEIAEGQEGTKETYAGTELTVYAGELPTAFAIGGGKVMLVGDVASVKAALDTGGKSALAGSEDFAAARAGIKGDHLGFLFLDVATYVDWASRLTESLGEGSPVMGLGIDDSMRAFLPAWVAGAVRVEGDAIAIDSVVPHLAINPVTENRAGTVADYLPPTTIFMGDSHELGRLLNATLELYRDSPATRDAFQQAEAAAGALGGFDAIIGWMGDSGVAVARTDDGLHGGAVIVPTDAERAKRLLIALRSFAALGGAQLGIEVRDEMYNGTTITIVDFGDLSRLGAATGGLTPIPLEGDFELAYAATDDVVIVGASPSFVRASLDAGPGKSLAEDARYRGLVERVGVQNVGVAFLDIDAIRVMVEEAAAGSSDDMATYEREYKPYLLPFDALVSATVVDGELDKGRALITVK